MSALTWKAENTEMQCCLSGYSSASMTFVDLWKNVSTIVTLKRVYTHDRVPAKAPPKHRIMIIIPYVLLNPKPAVEIAIPTAPYRTTGFRPKRSEAYVQGKTRHWGWKA